VDVPVDVGERCNRHARRAYATAFGGALSSNRA
jgi:uncharacterized membrane protein